MWLKTVCLWAENPYERINEQGRTEKSAADQDARPLVLSICTPAWGPPSPGVARTALRQAQERAVPGEHECVSHESTFHGLKPPTSPVPFMQIGFILEYFVVKRPPEQSGAWANGAFLKSASCSGPSAVSVIGFPSKGNSTSWTSFLLEPFLVGCSR